MPVTITKMDREAAFAFLGDGATRTCPDCAAWLSGETLSPCVVAMHNLAQAFAAHREQAVREERERVEKALAREQYVYAPRNCGPLDDVSVSAWLADDVLRIVRGE